MRRASLLLALGAAACGGADPASPSPAATVAADFILERRPTATGAEDLLPDPARRFPSGSAVVRATPAGAETLLSEGLAAAGAPSVRHDAGAVLFVGRERDSDALAVWTCAPDGSGRRIAARGAGDCLGAAFLADGRIVYAATTPEPSPRAGLERGCALFIAPGDGTAGARITFGAGLDADPFPLSDGRILFASWRPGADGGRFGLFTVFPDGTGFAPFHLAEGDALRPRQEADLDVTFALLAGGAVRVRRAAWDAPMSVAADEPVADVGAWLRTPLTPRPRPQGQLSVVKDDVAFGTLYCVDARRGAPGAARVRVRAWERGDPGGAVLGDTPLAADGSFHVRVPADRPIAFEALDATGRVVAAERGPIWVRGNEVRGCVGCHDDVETGPPNVRPLAVRQTPCEFLDARGGR